MKHDIHEKYTVAWFKLSHYIARKEKERSLALYRLLAHSMENSAYALQLEGDILWAFNDPQAFDRYYQAAQQYATKKQYLHAAMLYEQILAYGGKPSLDYARELTIWFSHVSHKEKIAIYAALWEQSIIDRSAWNELTEYGNYATPTSAFQTQYMHDRMREGL